jgi:hypothetical protein
MTLVPSDAFSISVPESLRPSLERHQANLVRLVESLRAAGMDEAKIEAAVTTLIDSYKTELLAAIKALSTHERELDEGR